MPPQVYYNCQSVKPTVRRFENKSDEIASFLQNSLTKIIDSIAMDRMYKTIGHSINNNGNLTQTFGYSIVLKKWPLLLSTPEFTWYQVNTAHVSQISNEWSLTYSHYQGESWTEKYLMGTSM